MKQGRSVWIIGLDAADHHLIERWVAGGWLPSFSGLLDQGVYGILESTTEVFSGSAWISIATGRGPEKCGVYSRYQLVNGTYDVRRIRADDCKVGPFWSAYAGPTVLLDIPKMPLSGAVDGVQIVEWGAYDHYAAFASAPAHLSNEISRDFGNHPFVERNFEVALHSRRDFDHIKTQVHEGVRMKQRLNHALLKRYKPRFFFSVFGETHAAGHAFWRFQDAKHPGHVPNDELQSALFETYQGIDGAIGETIEQLPKDAILLVLSSQGFSLDSMAGEGFLAEILVRMGVSIPRAARVNYAYAPYAPALSLDMSRTRAFCLPTDLQGYIRINLRGREPHGLVDEGEYESLCCELENELLALRDCTHKTPVVKHVVRLRELYSSDHADALPDLSIIWNNDHVVTGVESARLGVVRQNPDLTAGGGNHRGPGFMMMYGRDVAKGRLTGHVFDIAPTVSRLLGEVNCQEGDGKILPIPGLNLETNCDAANFGCASA
jgi:predicted AlkP superfamily phosphohydrolase/phosphomutase